MIIKEGIHQLNTLMHSIIITHFRLLDYINLGFSYLFERVIIIEAVITLIIKLILLKL